MWSGLDGEELALLLQRDLPFLAWQVEQLPRLQAVVCAGDQEGDGEVESDLAPLRQLLPQRRVVELAHGVAEIVSRPGRAVEAGETDLAPDS